MPVRDGEAHPPKAGSSGRLEGLSPEQLELLSLRLARTARTARKAGAPEGVQPPIPRRREAGPSPLSFAQQRIWILAQLAGDPAAYNLPQALRLAGPLDRAALTASLQAIFDRHEILRARFFTVDGLPQQEITPARALALPFVDLGRLPKEARDREAERLARADALLPFDLASGTLLRTLLVRLDKTEHLLLVNLHHIAADNLAVGLLVRELSALYTARVAGRGDPLPPPPLQYLDYVAWQRGPRGQLEAEVLAGHLAYWKAQLAGLPALDLPTDRLRAPRAPHPRFRGERCALEIPQALAAGLEAWARRQGGTLHMALATAWGAALGRFAEQTDFAVGMPLASRNRRELEGAIGLFSNTVVLRYDLTGDPSPRTLFERVKEATLAAHAHQDLPFDRLVEELAPARVPGRTPLFQAAFNLQRSPGRSLRLGEVELTPVEYFRGTANLDLYLAIEEEEGTFSGLLEVDADLFDPATARALNDAFLGFLHALVERPDLPLSRQPFPAALAERARAARLRDRRQQVRIAATFTAEPLERPLAFWLDLLDLPSEIAFAPYHQVLQELLDPAGSFAANTYGANVSLVRLEDFLRHAPPGTGAEDLLARAADDLTSAVATAAGRLSAPLFLVLCPSRHSRGGLVRRLEAELAEKCAGLPGVTVISAGEIEGRYPTTAAFDDYADRQGHIPFTAEGFAALASAIARRLYALRQPPLKVIAVDCDNTLWQGVAAEVGALGVTVGSAERHLQEFLVAQVAAGRLLCLVSKNRPEDVFEVLDRHPGMVLRREHVAAAEIGWGAKSEGLGALARELSLGLDSFAFLDDNPIEGAEVRSALPEVLTLELPAEPVKWRPFLEHVWAFDLARATAEDAKRTDLYRQNAEREKLRGRAATLAEFLEGLGLEVDCHPIRPGEISRVSQLIERTNQWNASTRRRSEAEIAAFLTGGAGGGEGWAVSVRDRFGDYGLVGVALFRQIDGALEIDTLLLSCRVLGRRVEHRLVARLGELAAARGLSWLDFSFRPTPRNQPVRDFLEELPAERRPDSEGAVFRLAAEAALGLAAAADPVLAAEPRAVADVERRQSLEQPATAARSELLGRIARELTSAADVARLAAQSAAPRPPALSRVGYVAPRNPLEEAVAEIWQEVLGVERVGIHDNFLTAGGHSLLGTVLLSRVYDAFGIELPLYTLFAAPTVAALAAQVEERLIAEMDAGDREAGLAEIEGLSPEELRLRVEEEAERVGSGRVR